MVELIMIENKLLAFFLDYCKSLLTQEIFTERINQVRADYIRAKTSPIILPGKHHKLEKTFVPFHELIKDVPAWYLWQVQSYMDNSYECDLGLTARTIPKILRIAESIDTLKQMRGFKEKFISMLNKNSKDIDNIIFEILVACTYLRNGANDIIFIADKNKGKHPDLQVEYNGTLYVECKRKRKESDYSKNEREEWYSQYLPVQDYLEKNEISLVLKCTFHNEIHTYEKNYLYDLFIGNIDFLKSGEIITNDEITLETYVPDFESVNKNDEIAWKVYTPDFTSRIFKHDNNLYGVTSAYVAEKRDQVFDYATNIKCACAGLWHCDSLDAIRHRSLSFKRHISDAVSQIPNDQKGAIHICFESYEGNNVEEEIILKTLTDLSNFEVRGKIIDYIYLHFVRLYIPRDKNWELEEDIIPLVTNNYNKIQFLKKAHVLGLEY